MTGARQPTRLAGRMRTSPGTTRRQPRYPANSDGPLIIDRRLTRSGLVPASMWVDTSDLPYSGHRALGGEIVIGKRDE